MRTTSGVSSGGRGRATSAEAGRAFHRDGSREDRCLIDAAVTRAREADGGSLRALLGAVLESPAYLIQGPNIAEGAGSTP